MLTYNAESFLRDAIESVLSQEVDFGVELVIGDDRSTDGTRELLYEYAAAYPNVIRVHLHERHGAGVPGRVNNMHNLRDCRGRYIAMLDGDDYWTATDKLARQVAILEAFPEYSSCSSDGVYFSPRRHLRALEFHPELRDRAAGLREYHREGITGITASSFVFRRAALLPLPGWFGDILAADRYIFLLVLGTGPCYFLPEETFAYREHDANFSADLHRDEDGHLHVYDDYDAMLALVPGVDASPGVDYARVRHLVFALPRILRARRWSALPPLGRRLRKHSPPRLAWALARGVTLEALRRLRRGRLL